MQSFCCKSILCLAGPALGLSLAFAAPLTAQEPPDQIPIDTKLLADDAVDLDNFGAALAIEADILAVAAPGADLDDADQVDSSGVVYMFLRDQTPASGSSISSWCRRRGITKAISPT